MFRCKKKEELAENNIVDEKPAEAKKKGKKSKFIWPGKRLFFWLKCGIRKIINWFTKNTNPLYKRGTHIITGYMGSGKTLLVNSVVNRVDPKKYFFISNIHQFKQENVYHHDIWDLFSNNAQIKKLPTVDEKGRKLYGLILDEINLKFNKRLNRNKDYNDKFIGLIEMIITSRHQGISRIYFIGQKLELQDSQLQSLFKYWHNILYSNNKGIWPYYKLENKLVFAPKKIIFEDYRKDIKDEYTFVGFNKQKIKYNDLITYNTFGMKELYDNLPTQQRFNYTKEFKDKLKKEAS